MKLVYRWRRINKHGRVHLVLTLVWLTLALPAVVLWRDSVPFLVFVSVYANVVGHWSSYEAATPNEE